MQSTGAALTAGITLPLVGLGVAAANAATDLDTQMRNIQSISKQSDADIAALSERFVQMSTDLTVTRDSAVELAEGFYQIQSSGFVGADAQTILLASTKAAAAGLTDTETAVKAITATLNAYGLGADQAAHVSDVLFKSVDVGIFSFEGIAGAIGDTLGTAAAAKVPFEELAAAFATITKAGISVDEAGTSINQLMLSYISPTDSAKEAAAALGIQLDVQALQTKGLSGVIKELAEHTDLLSTVATNAFAPLQAQLDTVNQQADALKRWKLELQAAGEWNKDATKSYTQQSAALKLQAMDIQAAMDANIDYETVMNQMATTTGLTVDQLSELFPNVRALRGALALAREGGAAFAEDLETMGNASGAAAAAFEIQTKSFAAQFDNLKNKGTATMIELGGVIVPILLDVVNGLTPLIEGLKTANPEWVKWALGIGAVLAALGPMLAIGGTLLTVLGALASPIGLLAIAAVALGFAWQTNFGGIRDTLMQVWAVVQPVLMQLWNILLVEGGKSLTQLAAFWNEVLLPALVNIWAWVQANLIPLFGQLFTWLLTNLPVAVQGLADFWNGVLLPALIAFYTWVITNVWPLFGQLYDWLQTNIPLALQTLSNFWTNVLLPAIVAVWTWMSTTLFPFLQAISDFFGAVFAKDIEILSAVWTNILQPALDSFWKVIVQLGDYLGKTFLPVFEKVGKWLGETLGPIIDGLVSGTLQGLIDAFNSLNMLFAIGADLISNMADTISKLSLPDWLTPGSPTPLELGLRGITQAMSDLNSSALPEFSANMSGVGANAPVSLSPVGAGAGGQTSNWTGDIVISGSNSPQETAHAVVQALQDRGLIAKTILR